MRQQLGGKVADEVPGRVVLVDNLAEEEEEHDAAGVLQLAYGVGGEDGLAAASDTPYVLPNNVSYVILEVITIEI